jgi:hypothetical protein
VTTEQRIRKPDECTRCFAGRISDEAPVGLAEPRTLDWTNPLCDSHLTILRLLGGGAPDRYAQTEHPEPTPVEPPKRYPARHEAPMQCHECGHAILADTEDWPEPLCWEHYTEAAQRQPRAVLSFDDGHREMRRNFIATKVYRDVVEIGDDVRLCWFEFVREQRENGKLVMQFYRQIPRPVDSLGRPLPKVAKARPSWWTRLVRWVRVAWALRGVA